MFFNKFKKSIVNNVTNPMINNSDLAYYIFCSLNIGDSIPKIYQNKINSLSNMSRKELLKYAISLIPNPTTLKELYTIAYCYVYMGASGRKCAIKYLNQYIKKGGLYGEEPTGIINLYGFDIDQRKSSIANSYHYLGQAYEGEYEFKNAFNAYMKEYELTPYYAIGIICAADICVKMNNIEKGLSLLKEAKKSPYYKKFKYKVLGKTETDDNFMYLINKKTKELTEKKEKGYIYRPRKRKQNT